MDAYIKLEDFITTHASLLRNKQNAIIKLQDFITTHASLLRNKQKRDHFESLASCAAALTGSKALDDPGFDVDEAEG